MTVKQHVEIDSDSGNVLDKLVPTQLKMLQIFRTYPNKRIVLAPPGWLVSHKNYMGEV